MMTLRPFGRFAAVMLLLVPLAGGSCRSGGDEPRAIAPEEPAPATTPLAAERDEHPPVDEPREEPIASPPVARDQDPEREREPREVTAADAPQWVQPFPHVRVNLRERVVEFDGEVCLTEGWLEQIVCTPGTREHETLIVSRVRPSNLHAAMLMARFEPGRPGRWTYENDTYAVIHPTGEAVRISVRYLDGRDELVEHPVSKWVRDHLGEQEFADQPWMFGGSMIAPNAAFMGPGEHYVADMTGSIVGLVTFGDELLGWREVIADQAAVSEPEWEANTDTMPPVGTKVTVILRRAEE